MISDGIDPIEWFVRSVRGRGAGSHLIVGPLTFAEFTVAVAARKPTSEFPFVSLSWPFDETWPFVSSAQDFFAALLKRDFDTVEVCDSDLELARAVEKQWPCAAATRTRERIQAERQRRDDWERRRVAYIGKREREGIKSYDAQSEYLRLFPHPDLKR